LRRGGGGGGGRYVIFKGEKHKMRPKEGMKIDSQRERNADLMRKARKWENKFVYTTGSVANGGQGH